MDCQYNKIINILCSSSSTVEKKVFSLKAELMEEADMVAKAEPILAPLAGKSSLLSKASMHSASRLQQ